MLIFGIEMDVGTVVWALAILRGVLFVTLHHHILYQMLRSSVTSGDRKVNCMEPLVGKTIFSRNFTLKVWPPFPR